MTILIPRYHPWLRTANGVYEPEFAGMRIASADCGLRTGCSRQGSQENADCECGLRTANGVFEAGFAAVRVAGCGLRII